MNNGARAIRTGSHLVLAAAVSVAAVLSLQPYGAFVGGVLFAVGGCCAVTAILGRGWVVFSFLLGAMLGIAICPGMQGPNPEESLWMSLGVISVASAGGFGIGLLIDHSVTLRQNRTSDQDAPPAGGGPTIGSGDGINS